MFEKQQGTDEYILKTGAIGANSLDIQHEMLKNTTLIQLNKANLTKGMIVWDIGCGSGTVTEYLAEKVGDNGKVYAIDISAEQIEFTKNRIDNAGYKNVILITGDINLIEIDKFQPADIVYSRVLLMHVKNPVKTIKRMAQLLKPCGVLSLQESTMSSVKNNKKLHPDFGKFYDLIIEYGKLKKFDYDVGSKITDICDSLNIFSKVTHYNTSLALTEFMKQLMLSRLEELEEKFIQINLISKDQYKIIKENISNSLQEEKNISSVMPEQTHVLAYKSSI